MNSIFYMFMSMTCYLKEGLLGQTFIKDCNTIKYSAPENYTSPVNLTFFDYNKTKDFNERM